MVHTLKGLEQQMDETIIDLRQATKALQDKLKAQQRPDLRRPAGVYPRSLLTTYILLLRSAGCRTWQEMVFALARECEDSRREHGAPSSLEFGALLAMAQFINFALIEAHYPCLSECIREFREATLGH